MRKIVQSVPVCEKLPGTRNCEDRVVVNQICCGLGVGKCVSIHPLAKEKQIGHSFPSRIARMTRIIEMRVAHT